MDSSLLGALNDFHAAVNDFDQTEPDEDRTEEINDCLASGRELANTVSTFLNLLGIENDWS